MNVFTFPVEMQTVDSGNVETLTLSIIRDIIVQDWINSKWNIFFIQRSIFKTKRQFPFIVSNNINNN